MGQVIPINTRLKPRAFVKVSRHSESLWLALVSERGNKLICMVANHPVNWPEKFGDRVEVERSEIVEYWNETPGGSAA